MNQPRLRTPAWWYKKERNAKQDELSGGNRKFLEERVEADFGPRVMHKGYETFESNSLLKVPSLEPRKWRKGLTRVGTIGRKLGHYPLWLKDGTRVNTTVLQIVDNHVIKCTKAGEYNATQKIRNTYQEDKRVGRKSCLLVGSESVDPNNLTANYIGLFKGSGVPPTKILTRFQVSKGAELPPGTPLNVTHYRVGDFVDVRSRT
jgi:large subunit ribosomal protein L3